MRAPQVFPAVRAALAVASGAGFRVLQFSVQDDHLHLIAEADDASAYARGLRGLAIRVARAVNHALDRRGAVWGDRYHARALTTPRAVRHALVYVLMNRHKHHGGEAPLDPCSSAAWFDGWREPVGTVPGPAPVVPARTWLAAVGWRRHGLVGIEERPRGGSCAAPLPEDCHIRANTRGRPVAPLPVRVRDPSEGAHDALKRGEP